MVTLRFTHNSCSYEVRVHNVHKTHSCGAYSNTAQNSSDNLLQTIITAQMLVYGTGENPTAWLSSGMLTLHYIT